MTNFFKTKAWNIGLILLLAMAPFCVGNASAVETAGYERNIFPLVVSVTVTESEPNPVLVTTNISGRPEGMLSLESSEACVASGQASSGILSMPAPLNLHQSASCFTLSVRYANEVHNNALSVVEPEVQQVQVVVLPAASLSTERYGTSQPSLPLGLAPTFAVIKSVQAESLLLAETRIVASGKETSRQDVEISLLQVYRC